MLPRQIENDGLTADFEEVVEPTKAHYINFNKNRCSGFIDEREALKQAIFIMLSIERYDHIIYSWNNFVELKDLFGMPTAYVASEAPRRIKECLLQDDRINDVDSFVVTTNKNKVHVQFIVRSIYGEIEAEREVIYA
ncbi:DUF2634 domain-containing protein [Solibacillus sp. A46]|uniref:DUF2634 domain-containing protein n=1 Tax=Solibacillus faecavium TaxID=2762221 RepID=A0ABR8XYS7_9BACL|nr:DUF2634 domain-containing protein [Solibacillus faecavium]MBD8037079.1 DUF2634 domain-containing protein [Solibacillus faecavium]